MGVSQRNRTENELSRHRQVHHTEGDAVPLLVRESQPAETKAVLDVDGNGLALQTGEFTALVVIETSGHGDEQDAPQPMPASQRPARQD
jgi:hypothetical protein